MEGESSLLCSHQSPPPSSPSLPPSLKDSRGRPTMLTWLICLSWWSINGGNRTPTWAACLPLWLCNDCAERKWFFLSQLVEFARRWPWWGERVNSKQEPKANRHFEAPWPQASAQLKEWKMQWNDEPLLENCLLVLSSKRTCTNLTPEKPLAAQVRRESEKERRVTRTNARAQFLSCLFVATHAVHMIRECLCQHPSFYLSACSQSCCNTMIMSFFLFFFFPSDKSAWLKDFLWGAFSFRLL